MKKLTFIFVLLLTFFSVSAQHEHSHNHNHRHDDHNYHFGVGAGVASFSGETGLEPSLHVHMLRKLAADSKWSLGIGYEGIKGEEEWHNGLNLLVNYRPFHFISFNAGPGIVIENEHDERELLPALHAESVVEFTVGDIHFGPMIGFGMNEEHTHFSLGLHLGFGI